MAGEFDAGFRFLGRLVLLGFLGCVLVGFILGHWVF